MQESYRLKRFLHLCKIFSMGVILLISVWLLTSEIKGEEEIDSKKYVIGSMIEIEHDDIEEIDEYVSEEPLEEEPLDTYTGNLTGYAADCPACYGTLGCLPSYNVYRNGVLTYQDKEYGSVRIVASSKKIPCGSIIRFVSDRVQEGDTYAIVLDRGVYNYNIDLLVPSEAYAYQYIGRSQIVYDVLRYGW